jgi:hypothetical protein
MTYKYYLSGSPLNFVSSGCSWIREFQAINDDQFYNSSDVFTISEETSFASGSLTNVDVRINTVIDPATGLKLGDSYKKLIFRQSHSPVGIGYLFYFNENYWISFNANSIKSLVNDAVIRRCNNVLRWTDINGNTYQEFCSIDPDFGGYDDNIKKDTPVTPGKSLTLYTQLNDKTKTIYAGQRFLFGRLDGEWNAFYTLGNAVRNFLNQKTTDNTSGQLLYLELGSHYINLDTDDLVLGIADKYKNSYVISASPVAISGSVGGSMQIYPTLTLNGDPISKPISYLSSASTIATVSGSGLVTFISTGSCNITTYMTNNTSASAITSVTISASAVSSYEIRVTPNIGYILEGNTTTFTVYGYIGGVVQADTFTFSLANANVPTNHYTKTDIGGNSFSIENLEKYQDYPLLINLVSGTNSKQISIELIGSF